jgi:hypothetical protein
MLVPAEMHQMPEKLSKVTGGMLVPAEMYLRPEVRLPVAEMLVLT